VPTGDETRAKEILFRYADRDFSFIDALGFAVMERLGPRLAFTFDRYFTQYGMTVVTTALLSTERRDLC
jgi:predicted nucleic acid-binding protein